MSSRFHAASLVDPATHSRALLDLIDLPISRSLIECLIDEVVATVDAALDRPCPSSPSSRGRSRSRHDVSAHVHSKLALHALVTDVLATSEVEVGAVLVALVYLARVRAKQHLHFHSEDRAYQRVFLGAIVVASKYLNDSSLTNGSWAICTDDEFSAAEVGACERAFLGALSFELGFTEAHILKHHAAIMAHVAPRRQRSYRTALPRFTPLETTPPSSFSDSDTDSDSDSSPDPSPFSSTATSAASSRQTSPAPLQISLEASLSLHTPAAAPKKAHGRLRIPKFPFAFAF
ncbi:hypothetical protein FA95DRAFT_282289 [Auriscalpium vulgare]|uniref:Uncharacterized protein n=1 Tax=Auriscalpium vulgare TaxID=40419 RepID=A0ACB8S5Q6_9AGAM|nr:hypothetical protein FA95DRAFT_282289 [Auriscalpium vulgare]